MSLIKSYQKKIFLLFSLASCTCLAYPDRLRRLMLLDTNTTILKVVDLISDSHAAVYHPKSTSSLIKKYLTPEEQQQFTTVERSLLVAFNKLAIQKTPIKLLWESHPNELMKNIFMTYTGSKFEEKFKPEKKESIQFWHADTLRRIVPNMPFLLEPIFPQSLALLTVKDLKLYLYSLIGTADAMLQSLKELPIPSTALLKEILRVKNGVSSLFNTVLAYDDAMPLADFVTTLKNAREYKKFKQAWKKYIINALFNIDVLYKIFISPEKHVIVYAGGQHCDQLAYFLTKKLKFKTIIDIGTQKALDLFIPLLNANAWNFLVEKPESSLQRYKLNGPLVSVLDFNFWYQEFEFLLEMLQETPLQELDRTSLVNDLKHLISLAFKAHIDLVNTQQVTSRKTILHIAAQKNIPEIVEVIMRYHPLLLLKDAAGKTALDYARENNAQEVVKLLTKK